MSTIQFKPKGITILAIFIYLVSIGAYTQPQPALPITPRPIVLKGTIVAPTHIIPGGWIVIQNNKIAGVYSSLKQFKMPADAVYIDTKGIIFPGLIDLHNHVTFNVFPVWKPKQQKLLNSYRYQEKFSNRYEWRYYSTEHKKLVRDPYNNMLGLRCKMNTYGELRALVGGTTTIANTFDDECIDRLVRNLDDPDQMDNRRIKYMIDISNQNPDKTQQDVENLENALSGIKQDLSSGNLDAFFIHLAEGKATDSISKGEFAILKSKGLLTSKTAIIHGIALGKREFHAMHNAGASLVWSPRSNIELYGQTTDIQAAKNAGLRIALSPDWAITGSKNLLDELHFAADWNKNHLNNLFTDKDLVEMVTSIPAGIAGVDDKIGSIREGLFADLLVISGDTSKPYSSLVRAGTHNVKLVLVNGSPVYGTKDLMEQFWSVGQLDQLLNSSPAMMLKLPLPLESGNTYQELRNSLSVKLTEEGTTLAPLFLPGRNQPVIKKVKPGGLQ